MLTVKMSECLSKALDDKNVKNLIAKREEDRNTFIKRIYTDILKKKSNKNIFSMIVRIFFDFTDKVGGRQEDVLVDVIFTINKKNGTESFKVQKPIPWPKLPK